MARRGPLLPGLLLDLALIPPLLIGLTFLVLVGRGAYSGGYAGREDGLVQVIALLFGLAAVVLSVVLAILTVWARVRRD